MSDWKPTPMHIILECNGELTFTEKQRDRMLIACAEEWERDLAKIERLQMECGWWERDVDRLKVVVDAAKNVRRSFEENKPYPLRDETMLAMLGVNNLCNTLRVLNDEGEIDATV